MRIASLAVVALLALAPAASAEDASARPPFEIVGGQLVLPGSISFETGTAALAPESEPTLSHIAAFLAEKPAITKIRIEAHVDASGPAESRMALTQARAAAVAQWLVAHGTDCHRLMPVGFGDTKPAEDGSTPAGRAANRRIVVAPCEMRNIPIGGMPCDGGGMPAGDPCPGE